MTLVNSSSAGFSSRSGEPEVENWVEIGKEKCRGANFYTMINRLEN
jgi:hypothetical protein